MVLKMIIVEEKNRQRRANRDCQRLDIIRKVQKVRKLE